MKKVFYCAFLNGYRTMLFVLVLFSAFGERTEQAQINQINFRAVEKAYYNEMIVSSTPYTNILCADLSRWQKAALCQYVFRRTEIKSIWRIHLNKNAYHSQESICINSRITFKVLFPEKRTDRLQLMLPCFGQHIPIHTSWRHDDFHEMFLLSTSSTSQDLYVFLKELRGDKTVYRVIQKLRIQKQPQFIHELTISTAELAKEAFLNTVVTQNINALQIEAIYVRDMIKNLNIYENRLKNVDKRRLLSVCLSIFTASIFEKQGMVIDRDAIISDEYQPNENEIVFQNETCCNGRKQLMYPCRAKHSSGVLPRSRVLMDYYQISSGRRPNSIFVYQTVDYKHAVRLAIFVENFDFDHLSPTLPDEMEEYPNFEETYQSSPSVGINDDTFDEIGMFPSFDGTQIRPSFDGTEIYSNFEGTTSAPTDD